MLWAYFFQCFVSSVAHHQHTAEVTTLKWSGDGKQFCSGSLDGSIKVGRDTRLWAAVAAFSSNPRDIQLVVHLFSSQHIGSYTTQHYLKFKVCRRIW